MAATLLQSAGGGGGGGGSQPVQVLLWVGVLIVVAVIGGAVAMVLRRRMFDRDAESSSGSLLEDLRRMKREGKISDAEFEQARRALSQKIARSLDDKRSHSNALRPRTGDSPPRPKPTPKHPGPGRDAPPGYDLTGEPLPRPHDPE